METRIPRRRIEIEENLEERSTETINTGQYSRKNNDDQKGKDMIEIFMLTVAVGAMVMALIHSISDNLQKKTFTIIKQNNQYLILNNIFMQSPDQHIEELTPAETTQSKTKESLMIDFKKIDDGMKSILIFAVFSITTLIAISKVFSSSTSSKNTNDLLKIKEEEVDFLESLLPGSFVTIMLLSTSNEDSPILKEKIKNLKKNFETKNISASFHTIPNAPKEKILFIEHKDALKFLQEVNNIDQETTKKVIDQIIEKQLKGLIEINTSKIISIPKHKISISSPDQDLVINNNYNSENTSDIFFTEAGNKNIDIEVYNDNEVLVYKSTKSIIVEDIY